VAGRVKKKVSVFNNNGDLCKIGFDGSKLMKSGVRAARGDESTCSHTGSPPGDRRPPASGAAPTPECTSIRHYEKNANFWSI
jgi:hypothetical protein